MHCHFATARVINTFFILYTRQDIIVLLAAIPPNEYVLKQLSRMLLASTTFPEGNKTRTIGSLKTETLQTPLWLEHTQRRDKVSK